MKRILTIFIHLKLMIAFSLTYQQAYASSWPIFMAPDYQFLLKLHYIETSQCPNGQGKMIEHPRINIQQYLCRNFCPEEWRWIGNSDNQCHDLSDFRLKHVEITHYSDGSETSYSVITAAYGQNEANNNVATFTMTTQPGEHWFCIMLKQEMPLLSCANDIRYKRWNPRTRT